MVDNAQGQSSPPMRGMENALSENWASLKFVVA